VLRVACCVCAWGGGGGGGGGAHITSGVETARHREEGVQPEMQQTKPLTDTLSPVWNENFKCDYAGGGACSASCRCRPSAALSTCPPPPRLS
jgi:hypothetical protein